MKGRIQITEVHGKEGVRLFRSAGEKNLIPQESILGVLIRIDNTSVRAANITYLRNRLQKILVN